MGAELLRLLGPEILVNLVYVLVYAGLAATGSIITLVVFMAKRMDSRVESFQKVMSNEIEKFNVSASGLENKITLLIERDRSKDGRIEDNKFHISQIYKEIDKVKNSMHDLRDEMITSEYVDLVVMKAQNKLN